MARITDSNRIKRLKDSTMKLVVEKGFGGASAANIALDANVAAGYFYMHYKGKYEMVNSLLQEVFQEAVFKLEEYLEGGHSFNEVVNQVIDHIFTIANTDPVKLKFLYVLSNDYSFVIDNETRQKVHGFLAKLIELGKSNQSIDPKLTENDLYLLLLVNTIQYINLRFKYQPENLTISMDDKEHLRYLLLKVLKQNS
jgi:AcrR family transcriptional regulator